MKSSTSLNKSYIPILLLSLALLISCISHKQGNPKSKNYPSNDSLMVNRGADIAGYPSKLDINFNNYTDGIFYSKKNAIADFVSLKFWDPNPTLSIKTLDPKSGNKGLRVFLPKDLYNNQSGIIAETYLAEKNEYTLEYKVLFEQGFEFSRSNDGQINGGGKLPGICGGSRPSGCKWKPAGMSSRIMFRKNPTRQHAYLELYQYWNGQTVECGESTYLIDVKTDRWYTIKMKVNLGSATADGKINIWIDGHQKLSKNIRYINEGEVWILSGLMLHSFMGGNESFWAPSKDIYLVLDDIKVY